MPRLYRIILIILSVITGATFLYSAYTKLFPIQSFEYTMMEYTHLPAMAAAVLARVFTGLEAALGGMMVLHLYGRNKWALKVAFALLILFSVYLVWLWAVAGNDVNCGCFGDTIWMSPSVSLVKNTMLLIITGLLIRYHDGWDYTWARVAAISMVASVIVAMFVFFPLFSRYKIDLLPLYTSDSSNVPDINLSHGKHILAFLSPSCIHCRKAGLLMHQMEMQDTTLPFFLVIGGTTSDLKDFWKASQSQAQTMHYIRLPTEPFMKYTKGMFPTILWINNGWVEADLASYKELDRTVIKKWMKQ